MLRLFGTLKRLYGCDYQHKREFSAMTDQGLWFLLRSKNGISRPVLGMPTSQGWYYFGSSDDAQDAHSATWFNNHKDIVDVAWEIIDNSGDSAFENEAIYRMRAITDGEPDGDGFSVSMPKGKYAMVMYYAVIYDPIRGWNSTEWPYERD